jgi:hypothetical protein
VPSAPFNPVAVRKTSSGAVEVLYVPCWPAEIQTGLEEGKAGVVVLLTTPSDFRVNASFRLEDLDGAKVRFHTKNMTPEQFEEEKERTCE